MTAGVAHIERQEGDKNEAPFLTERERRAKRLAFAFIDPEPTINSAIHHFDENPERFEGKDAQKSWLRREIKEMKS